VQRRHRRTALLVSLLVLLAGCWDRREIEERANVLASGVDLCEPKEGCNLIVSRQIAIPGRIPLGGASPGGSSKGESVVAFSTPGRDVLDTAGKAQAELNRTISFGHTRILVFSEAFARKDLSAYLDYVRRVPEVRRLMWLTVTEGKARDVIRSRPSLEIVPALYLNDLFDDGVKTGRIPEMYLGEFLTRVSNLGEESIAPLIRMVGLDHPALTGLAVFRDYRMVGKLTNPEMYTFMQLRGLKKGSELINVALPGGKEATVRVYERKARYRLRLQNGRLTCAIKISLEAELATLSPELASDDPRQLAEVERRAAAAVVQKAQALFQKLQHEYQADILGVGERVRAYLPRYWQTVKGDWPKAFAQTQFQVDAVVHVRRTGLGKD
jgi:spore germination protein KC